MEDEQPGKAKKKFGRVKSKQTVVQSDTSPLLAPNDGLATLDAREDPSVHASVDRSSIEYMRQWTEHLNQWTNGQQGVIRQIFDKQCRLEAMVEQLLQNSLGVDTVPAAARVEGEAKSVKIARPADEPNLSSQAKEAGDVEARMADADYEYGIDTEAEARKSVVGSVAGAEPSMVGCSSDTGERQMQKTETTKTRITERSSLGRLNSVLVQAIWNMKSEAFVPEKHSHGWCTHLLEELVEDPRFEVFSACLIFSHSVFIGIYIEYVASVSTDVPTAFKVLNIVLTVGFILEVLLKAIAERAHFLLGPERSWNLFDCLLLTTVVVEIITGVVLAGQDAKAKKNMKTALKLAEMARTLRILRIFKFLKFSQTLRVLLAKIFSSVRILLWVFALLLLIIFVVAVCMTQAYNDTLLGQQHEVGFENMDSNQKAMDNFFGSIPRSAYTLVAAICVGLEWDKPFTVLAKESPFYASIFLGFIMLTIFAGMNILTGVFVDHAINCNSDIAMDLQATKQKEQANHLREMFKMVDRDASDIVTCEEFVKMANHPALSGYLKAVNVGSEQAANLFNLLDEDGSGEITIDEFIFGCMHLHGEASSIDMKTLLHESRRMRHKVFKHIGTTEDTLNKILAHLKPQICAVQRNIDRKPAKDKDSIKKAM